MIFSISINDIYCIILLQIFARVVQLSKIDNTIWAFLSGVKASGTPLSRATLAKRCRKDLMLLTALTSLTIAAVRTGNGSLKNQQRSAISAIRGTEAILSFYTATVIDVLEAAHTVSDAQLRVLYPFLIGGLGGEGSDQEDELSTAHSFGPCSTAWKKASCMLVSEIVRMVQLGQPLVKSLVDTIANSISLSKTIDYGVNTDIEDLLMAFTIVAQYQDVVCGPGVLKKLFWDDVDMSIGTDILGDLDALAHTYSADISPVITTILSGAVACLSGSNSNNATSNSQEANLSPHDFGVIFLRVASAGVVDGVVMRPCVHRLLETYMVWESKQKDKKEKKESSVSTEYRTAVEDILRAISQRYPADFDSVVHDVTESHIESDKDSKCISALLKKVFQKSPYKLPSEAGVGMLLGLSHSSPELRAEALQLFSSSLPIKDCTSDKITSDVVGLCSAALSNFSGSSDIKVLVAASESDVLERVVSSLPVAEFLTSLSSVFSTWSSKISSAPKQAKTVLVSVLTGVFDPAVLKYVATTTEAVHTLMLYLLTILQSCRYILPRSDKAVKYCRNLLKAVEVGLSNLGKYSVLLAGFSAENVDSENDDIDGMCEVCTSNIATIMAKNIIKSGFDAVQDLIGLYESLKKATDVNRDFLFRLAGLTALLGGACEEVIAATNKSTVTGVIQQVFSVFVSWTTFFYERVRVDESSAHLPVLNDQVDEALSNTLQIAMSSSVFPEDEGNVTDKKTMADICSVYMDGLISTDSSVRLLVCLLDLMADDSERATPLIGLCVQAFYSSSPIQILAQIGSSACSGDDTAEMSEVYSNALELNEIQSASGKACSVTADSRASALYTLSAYLRFMLSSEVDENILSNIVSLVPALVTSLGDSFDPIRVAALTIVDELCELSTDLELVVVDSNKKQLKYDSSMILFLAQLFQNMSSSIVSDESMSSQIIGSDVFLSESSMSIKLTQFMLHLVVGLGWKSPKLSNFILECCVQKSATSVSWPWAKQLLSAAFDYKDNVTVDDVDIRNLGCTLLRACTWNINAKTSKNEKNDIINALCGVLPQKNSTPLTTLLRSLLFGELSSMSLPDSQGPRWLDHMTETELVLLFNSITSEMASDSQVNSRDDFVSSLQAIPVPVECAYETLLICQSKIQTHLASFEANECDGMEVEGDGDMVNGVSEAGTTGHGLALPLQYMCMYLDSISPVIQNADGKDNFDHLSKCSVILLDILTSLNMPQISTVLTIGYCRGLLLDLSCTCLGKIYSLIPATVESTPAKSRKSTSSKSKKNALVDGLYTHSRVNSDIEAILQCLQLSSTSYVQTFSLKLLDILLSLMPTSVDSAVLALSHILSSATAGKGNISCDDSNGLVGGIIRTTTAIRASKHKQSEDFVISYPQEVLEPLFSNFSVMSFDKRLALMKIAFQEFDDNALPTSIALTLAHSLAAYGCNSSSRGNSITKRKSNADIADNENGDVFVLLSRSAQRKANASRKVSESEEFFSLATKASFLKPTNVQMQSLVVVTRMAKNMLTYLVKGEIDMSSLVDEEDEENLKINGQSIADEDEMLTCMDEFNPDVSKSVFSLSKYVAYANRLLKSNATQGIPGDDATEDDTSSNGAALTILLMEYILEFVENTKFHDAIISTFEVNSGSEMGDEVQSLFLVLCEQLLELLAFSTHIQHSLARSKTMLSVNLGGSDNGLASMTVRPSSIAKRVWMLSLDVIHAIQRLLDGPTFIVILQELINHEHISVRQKSLQILGDRLQLVAGTKRARHDSALYLDLASQLLDSVKESVPDDILATSMESQEVGHELVGRLGIAQSALLGIDILARQFASAKEWASPMTDALGQLSTIVQGVADTIQDFPVDAAVTQEVFKLLGSFYLCCGTLCSAAKVRSLPFLESLMNRMLNLIEGQGAILLQYDASVVAEEPTTAIARVQCRNLTLLIRSCVSAVASIVTDLSSFFHPYMPRFLEAVTPLQSLRHTPDASLLGRDIEQCLFVVTTKVPARLAIPAILQASVSVFTNKKDSSLGLLHATAAKLADFQFANWEALDRSSVTSHLDSLQSISLVGLNYRYTSGDQTSAGDSVDDHVCTAVIEFCLKLTEKELREFLVQLVDMKDNVLPDPEAPAEEKYSDWRIYSRSVVFFQLLSGLNGKLKHIFVPLMGLVWQGAADHLSTLIDFVKEMKPYAHLDVAAGKKGKKRKLLAAAKSSVVTANSTVQQQVLHELIGGCGWVLKTVRKCCVNDNINFIDQYQYETIIRQMSALYAMREAFSDDAEYLAFAGDLVLPCIVQLVIAVGKDLLWKSLNHDILVMMRSNQKSVKIAALRGLQKLFTDVGEEYLILLPECLPFLSEILEDSDSGVVALASQVIQSIEDLSGESLDSYLR